jgi:hypothetical protein
VARRARISAARAPIRHASCGWRNAAGHLDQEPVIKRDKPSQDQKELTAARANLFLAYAQCRAAGDEVACEQITDSVAELDDQLSVAAVCRRWSTLGVPVEVFPITANTTVGIRRYELASLPFGGVSLVIRCGAPGETRTPNLLP